MNKKNIKRIIGNSWAIIVVIVILGAAFDYIKKECAGPEGSYFQWQLIKLLILLPIFSLMVKFWDKIESALGKHRFLKWVVWGVVIGSFFAIINSFVILLIPKNLQLGFKSLFNNIFSWPVVIAFVVALIIIDIWSAQRWEKWRINMNKKQIIAAWIGLTLLIPFFLMLFIFGLLKYNGPAENLLLIFLWLIFPIVSITSLFIYIFKDKK